MTRPWPAQPGYPLNPQSEGWHILLDGLLQPQPYYWLPLTMSYHRGHPGDQHFNIASLPLYRAAGSYSYGFPIPSVEAYHLSTQRFDQLYRLAPRLRDLAFRLRTATTLDEARSLGEQLSELYFSVFEPGV